MYKKLVKGVALCLVVAAVAGIFYYMLYLNNQTGDRNGTLVNTFQRKVDEAIV